METTPTVRLLNDIAEQFEHLPHDQAVDAIAKHVNLFWDPRMRRTLLEQTGAADLSDLGRDSIAKVEVRPETVADRS